MTEPLDLEAVYRAAQPEDAARARRRAAVLDAVNGEAPKALVASNDSQWRRLPRWGGGVALVFVGVMGGLVLRQAPKPMAVPHAASVQEVAVAAAPQASMAALEAAPPTVADVAAPTPAKVPARKAIAAATKPRTVAAPPPDRERALVAPDAPAQAAATVRAAAPPAQMTMAPAAPMLSMPAPIAAAPQGLSRTDTQMLARADRAARVEPAAVDLPLDADGRTPLMLAVRAGDLARVHALLQQGANRDVRDHFGKRAIDYAYDAQSDEMIEAIRAR